MRGIRLGMVMLGLIGLTGGGVPVADAQSEYRQCYYRPELDPKNSCTACYNICMGAGYVCCTITPIAPHVDG